MSNVPIGTLVNDLAVATADWQKASLAEREANQWRNACQTRVNKLQEQIDAKMAELRVNAPPSTHWKRPPGMPA